MTAFVSSRTWMLTVASKTSAVPRIATGLVTDAPGTGRSTSIGRSAAGGDTDVDGVGDGVGSAALGATRSENAVIAIGAPSVPIARTTSVTTPSRFAGTATERAKPPLAGTGARRSEGDRSPPAWSGPSTSPTSTRVPPGA
jgi:hypothetical protein